MHIFHIPAISLSVIFSIVFSVAAQEDRKLAERTPFAIPLLKLALMQDSTAMRIAKPNDDDYAVVGIGDDLLVSISKDKTTKTVFKEYNDQAHYLSDFEARQLELVTHSLILTLEDLERDLQQEKWGHCLYLDGFLPKFLRNFYMLLGIIRNNATKYDDQVCLFENKFEVSLNSPLSDQRLSAWQSSKDGLMKLRIVSKELAHQLHLWEKRELSNKSRNPEVPLSAKVEETLELFVKIYFDLKYPDGCPPTYKRRARKQN